jgi:hypothetical protein
VTDSENANVQPPALDSPASAAAAPACNPALLDPAGAVAGDLPCCKCGYNLRGLRPADRCPECAASILTTVTGNLLRFADRKWLTRVDNGVRWMLWAGAGVLALSSLFFVPVFIPTARLPMWLPIYLTPVMQLARYYGVWLFTTREPGCMEAGASVRAGTRIAVVAWLAARTTGLLLATNPWGAFVGSFFSACAGAVADVTALILLAHLMARVPNPRLARRITLLAGLCALGFVVVLAAGLTAWLGSLLGASSPAATTMMNVAGNCFVLPSWILFIAQLVALFFVTKALAPVLEEPPSAE